MDSVEGKYSTRRDLSGVRDRPRKRGALPCGSRVCLRCHKGCGVIMSAYLSGLEEPSDATKEPSNSEE